MEETHKEVSFVRTFDAPREIVFRAWTDPKLLSEWWGPEGVFTPVCEIDPKKGGKLYIVMEAGEALGAFKGTQWPMKGEYEEVEFPSKIVFTSTALHDGKESHESRTTVTFAETDGKTTMHVDVVVTKIMPGAEYAIQGMEQGWNSQFDKLGKFLLSK